MVRVRGSVCIDESAAEVWRWLARLEDLTLWSEPVLAARCDPSRAGGVGAERVCELRGGITLRERWLTWDEGRSYSYEGFGIPMVRRARNTWTVEPHGDRQSVLTTDAEVTLRGGWLGRLAGPVVVWQSRRMGRRSLAAFKYLVEHDEPAPVAHARLPFAAVTC